MKTCKGCGAAIIWIRTPGGKSIPCDPEQVLYRKQVGGGIKIITPNGEVLSAKFEGNPNEADGIGYVSHFATCPEAGRPRGDHEERPDRGKDVGGMIDEKEVLKALVCRSNDLVVDCAGCPYYIADWDSCDYQRICRNAIDLLREKENEITALRHAPRNVSPHPRRDINLERGIMEDIRNG